MIVRFLTVGRGMEIGRGEPSALPWPTFIGPQRTRDRLQTSRRIHRDFHGRVEAGL